MQIQKKQKASILIWVFFLTLLMSFSFIFIQFQIKNSLSTNSKKLDSLEKEKNVQEFMGDINSKTQKIGENTLEIKDFSSFEYALKKDEILELKFNETGSVNLELLNSGIISYNTDGSDNFGINVLPTYNTGTTQASFPIDSTNPLKIKNFSGYSKIRIGASKKFEYSKTSDQSSTKLKKIDSGQTRTLFFEKAGKITISLYKMSGETAVLEYKTTNSGTGEIIEIEGNKYTNKSFFIKSKNNLEITNKSSRKAKVIVSGDYNISDMLENNSYKITKETWGREIVLEKGKIK